MAVQYINAFTGVNSVTLPSGWQAGDLAIVFAFRDGNTTSPTVPATFTSITSGGGNTCSAVSARRFLVAGDSSFTFTNATTCVCLVYRGVDGNLSIGASAQAGLSSNVIAYPAVTLQDTSGSSWCVRFAGHRSVDIVMNGAPTGYTQRIFLIDSVDSAHGVDSNGGVTSVPSVNRGVSGTSSGYRAHSIELRFTSTLPVITTQPVNQTVNEGQTATFTVAGTNITSYQWQFFNGSTWQNVTDGTGGNTASYTTIATTSAMNGRQYRCSVNGSLLSNTVTLTVNPSPEYVRVSWVEFAKAVVATSRIKYWNGSAWVQPVVKYWNGSAWVE